MLETPKDEKTTTKYENIFVNVKNFSYINSMEKDTIDGQSAAKPLLNEEGSTTIPSGSTLIEKEEKVALFNFYTLIDPRDNKPKYIGRTVDCKNRLRNHFYESRKNNKTKKERWLNLLSKKGILPEMRVLHSRICSIDKAIELEKRLVLWFSKYVDLKNEPDNYLGAVLTGKPVHQYNLKGKYLATYANSNQAYLITKIKDCNIGRACKGLGKYTCKTAGGYLWSYELYDTYPYKYNSNINNLKGKPVLMFSKDNVLIKEFETARIASKETGICWKIISQSCIKKQTPRKSNFIWRFK